MGVDHQLGQSEDLATEMEGITEARLLSLLGGERLDGLQVEVVVEMQVVEVLTMNQQIQHVVALSAHLQVEKFMIYNVFVIAIIRNIY